MIVFALRLALALPLLLLPAALPAAPAATQVESPPREYWPTEGWRTAAPEARGLDPALLAAADRRVRAELPRLSALLVVRGGDLVFEAYYDDQPADEPIHLWSATSSTS